MQQENLYQITYKRATCSKAREDFWRQEAQKVSWFNFPSKILDCQNPPFSRWFCDGSINITYNMFDRYLAQNSDKKALIWVSNMVKKQKIWTLKEAYIDVCKMCCLMKKYGVKKGDRVIIYTPMIPQALFASWACARIGAVHSIVFGGFAAKQLAGRIIDSQAKLIVTASCGIEPHKQVNYVEILQEALQMAKKQPTILIYQRQGYRRQCNKLWQQFDITKLPFEQTNCEPMNSNDYLYILYTSGTTGSPKGIVRDHGGTTVALQWTMNHIMGINLNDTYFAASDIGWVVGHSFSIYGPLLRGAATVLYQGKPTYPNPGALWEIIQKYKVKGLYTSPTALRAIRKEDQKGQWIQKYNISSLEGVSMAGQRCDIPTYEWIQSKLKVLINDNYWQTECGWIISCNYKNLHTFKPKPGSATKPCPGFQIQIINQNNQKVPRGTQGKVCIKLPMPPSFMLTLFNNDKGFLEKYINETPGYYTTGDAGYFDEDGYLNVMTRLDDVINTAGHRLSTAQIQQELMMHPSVSQSAIVAKIQELKGQIPIGFVVLKKQIVNQNIQKELISLIRKQIGPVAAFNNVIIVDKLPKTRSGKIIRYVLRKMVQGEKYKYPATIEDDEVLTKIQEKIKEYGKGLGQTKKLVYRGDIDLCTQDFSTRYEQQNSKKKIKEV